jgi:hypothetical protein
MVAMRGRNYYFFDPVIDKRFDILLGQVFEYFLTARLADAFSSAVFFITQYPKIYPRLIKDIGSGSSYLFHSWVIAEVAADEI